VNGVNMHLRPYHWIFATLVCIVTGCAKFIEHSPAEVTDTGNLTVICDATLGNRGLLDFEGDVFVHVGLITNRSRHRNEWRYVKFNWGSREPTAKAEKVAANRWSYTITNLRNFFGVPDDEQIQEFVILFRSGACIDIYCKSLRNEDNSDIHIPVVDQTDNIE